MTTLRPTTIGEILVKPPPSMFLFIFIFLPVAVPNTRLSNNLPRWGKVKGSKNFVFFFRIAAMYSAGLSKSTGRLPRMLPLVLREIAWAVFRFSRVVVWLFVHIASAEDIMTFNQKYLKIHYYWPQFWLSITILFVYVFLTVQGKLIGCSQNQTINRTTEKRETVQESFRKGFGEHYSEESTSVFGCPAE